MSEKLMWGALAAVAGIAAALQGAANAGLSSKIGLGSALIVNTTIVLLANIVFWIALGPKTEFFPAGTSWTYYIGGVCGFIVILAIAFVIPKQGAALTIALMVLGQGMAALLIDHYGLMGIPQESISPARLGGVGLVLGGIVLMRW